jgi:uncharacterized alpha-E superfamily protein
MSVLKSLSAYQMYRLKVQDRVSRRFVLEFLFKEEQFPRSFYHCLLEVQSCLKNLPRNEAAIGVLNEIGKEVIDVDQSGLRQDDLHEFIDELQLGIAKTNTVITETYFE